MLVNNQEHADLSQSYENAALIRSTLYTSPPELPETPELDSKRDRNPTCWSRPITNGCPRVRTRRRRTCRTPSSRASTRVARRTRSIDLNKQIIFVVGVPVPAVETQVYEVFQLKSLEHTLRILLLYMGMGALLTTLIGMGGGMWVTRRAVRPLIEVSDAAALIAQGELSTRLADHPRRRRGPTTHRVVQPHGALAWSSASSATPGSPSDVSHECAHRSPRSPRPHRCSSSTVRNSHRAGQESLEPVARGPLDLPGAGRRPARDGAQ